MKPVRVFLIFTAALAGGFPFALAQSAPDDVIVENAAVKLTRADYEAELQRIPADNRAAFAMDPKRVSALLRNMLIGKTMAVEARKAGLDRDPLVQRRIALEADKVLAEVEVQRIETVAGAEFDAKVAQFLPKARERYLVDKVKYVVPEQIEASHILFLTKARNEDAAMALAQQVEVKLAAGADFTALAREFSEDPGTKDRGGHIGWFDAKQMDPGFSKAAFALKNIGDVSPPALSRFGSHVIRLDGRRPQRQRSFDEVKDELIADLRQAYVAEQRALKIDAIGNGLKVNQPVLDALIVPAPDSATLRQLLLEHENQPGRAR
jgi:peptidyl-prolyl cis-trans isomerase C